MLRLMAVASLVACSAAFLPGAGAIAAPLDKETCANLEIQKRKLLTPDVRAALERGPDWVKGHLDSDKIEMVREFLMVEEQVAFRCREGLPKITPQTVSLPDRNPKRVLEAAASSTAVTKTSQTVADSDKTAPPQTKTTR
ncbi:MAG: hypothetical protein ABWY38_00500 [Methyloceanibacter sp.]